MGGYLAYSEGRPVGWCNVNWRHAYTTLDPAPASDARTVAIVCFVVAKAFRGRGIAGRLLDAACVGARQLGATEIEAYPLGDSADEAANHYGPLPMYLAAGFEAVSEQDGRVTVRKALNGASQPATGI
jgi:GNAT superfamily N-acetyltransferase